MSTNPIVELALANKLLSSFNPGNSFSLYSKNNIDSFKQFIIDSRFSYFQLIQAVLSLDENETFLIGYQTNYYMVTFNDNPDDDKKVSLGPGIFKKIFSRREVIDFLLSNLGFSALIIDMPSLEFLDLVDASDNIVAPSDEFSHCHFVNEDFQIIARDSGISLSLQNIVGPENLIIYLSSKIKLLHPQFSYFLDYEVEFGVKHSIYIEWLLNLFPGYIHAKSLN